MPRGQWHEEDLRPDLVDENGSVGKLYVMAWMYLPR
jgi:hypothetical protein